MPSLKMILLYLVWMGLAIGIMIDPSVLTRPSIVCVAPLAVATVAGLCGRSILVWGVVSYAVGLVAMLLAGAAYALTIQSQDGIALVSLGSFVVACVIAMYYLVREP